MNPSSQTQSYTPLNLNVGAFITQSRRKLAAFGVVLLLAFIQSASAQFAFPWYEPFTTAYTNGGAGLAVPEGGSLYPAQPLGGTTSVSVWNLGNATGGGSAQIVGGAAAMTYPGLATNPTPTVGLYITTNRPSANRSKGVLLQTVTNGSLYMSFLINVEQAPDPAIAPVKPLALFCTNVNVGTSTAIGSSGVALAVGLDSLTNVLLFRKNLATAIATNPVPLSPGTHLIVARYTFNPISGSDESALWVDPSSGTFGASTEPTPGVAVTNTSNVASIPAFWIYHPGTSTGIPNAESVFIDEITVSTNWAQVTPTGVRCVTAGLVSSPTNTTVTEGVSAQFSAVAGGTQPTYQWQISTNSGTTWNPISSATNSSYLTPLLTTNDNGGQYRAVMSVACDGSSVTSAVATVTVNAATVTPDGIVLDDVFNGVRNSPPVTSTHSLWYASTGGTLGTAQPMIGTPNSGTSTLWIGYYTDSATLPVHLDVGHQMKVTMVFTPTGVVSNGGNSLRMGIYDYADGGTRVSGDNFGNGSSGSATNVRGYMLVVNFGTNFSTDMPLALYARNNYGSANLMGTIGDYLSLGSGPVGGAYSNAPAFQEGAQYTLQFTATRTGLNSVNVGTSISGGGTNWSYSVTDTNYAYPRFDAFGIRPNTLETTATFSFSEFKVEVLTATLAPTSIAMANISRSGNNVSLSWSPTPAGSYTYTVWRKTNLLDNTWTSLATGLSTPSYTDTTATGTTGFYRVSSP